MSLSGKERQKRKDQWSANRKDKDYLIRINDMLKRPNPNINKLSELLILVASTYLHWAYTDSSGYPKTAEPFIKSIQHIWDNKMYNLKFLKYFIKVFKFCNVEIPFEKGPLIDHQGWIDITIDRIKAKANYYLSLDKEIANDPKIIEYVAKNCYTKLIEHPLVPFKEEYLKYLDNRWCIQRLYNSSKFKDLDSDLKYKICLKAIKTNAVVINSIDPDYHTKELIDLSLIHQGRHTIHYFKTIKRELTYEQWLTIVKSNWTLFSCVPKEHHTKEMLDIAIKNGENLRFMEQTPEYVLAAVKSSGANIRYVAEQTSDLCYEAVKNGASWDTLYSCKIITPKIAVAAACIGNINFYNKHYFYNNIMQYGLPKELHYTPTWTHTGSGLDPRNVQVRWWIMREQLFQIGMALFNAVKTIYPILWITDHLDFFELSSSNQFQGELALGPPFTLFNKVRVLQVIEHNRK